MHWFSYDGLVTVVLLKSCCASATNKRLNRDKLQLAGSATLHIIANNNLPIKRALYISGVLIILEYLSSIKKKLLTITEVGMTVYWVFAVFVIVGLINVPPEYMYSDYQNPIIVSWNWSFFPIDILFAALGLFGRFGKSSPHHKQMLSTASLSLMFCAGLMAISFWLIKGEYDPFWWGINLWLVALSSWVFIGQYRAKNI